VRSGIMESWLRAGPRIEHRHAAPLEAADVARGHCGAAREGNRDNLRVKFGDWPSTAAAFRGDAREGAGGLFVKG
jgi:hypothetical protein